MKPNVILYYPLHHNLEFYKALLHVPFTTSKIEPDIWCKKPFLTVASMTTNYVNKEISEKSQNCMGIPLVPSRNKFLALSLKKYEKKTKKKTEIKIFRPCLSFLGFLNFLKIFCAGSLEINGNSHVAPAPCKLQYFDIFRDFKVFLKVNRSVYITKQTHRFSLTIENTLH